MFFVDKSGHLFNLPDYDKKPVGYEFDTQDYIFWFENSNYSNRLSINNYYVKSIHAVIDLDDIDDFYNTEISSIYSIDITCESNIFHLIKSSDLQNSLNETKNILDYIEINDHFNFLSSDNDDDFIILKMTENEKNYVLIPIYIIANSNNSGTWTSNILIHIKHKFTSNEIYCPISIGGIFCDEYETLTINGKNMGVDLPKEILRAVNGVSFYNDSFDEELYNRKIKEYMINYMSIHGEKGNYRSAIHGLKWFGFGDKLELYKLIKTDNEFKNQFIRDFFDIDTDIILAFKNFVITQYIGLKYKLNEEIGELDNQDYYNYDSNNDNALRGEGLPLLSDIDNKIIFKYTDEFFKDQKWKYKSTLIKYSINELMLKLSALSYYYQKYFLPIYSIIHKCNIEYKVYANNVKHVCYTRDRYFENIINLNVDDNIVIFPKENYLYFTHQKHKVDRYFNEFNEYDENDETYIINDTCLFIPIKFKYIRDINEENELNFAYYNCIFILKDLDLDKIIYKEQFSFYNNLNKEYNGFVFYPKKLFDLDNLNIYTYINKKYVVYINVNNKWYEYVFTSKMHDFDVHIGTLEYKYWINDVNYLYDYFNVNKLDNTNRHIIFKFNNENTNLDITEYIKHYDFFDQPLKYFSNFSQIKDIKDGVVHFNSYMHEPDFVNVNDIEFGLMNNISENIKDSINKLVHNHRNNIQIISNDKYLNNVVVYDLYENKRIEGKNILKYKNDINILCDNIFISKEPYDDKFNISLINNDGKDEISTLDDINYYLLDHTLDDINGVPSIIVNKPHYFVLKRITNNLYANTEYVNADNKIYSIEEDKTKKHNVGYLIYDFNDYKINFIDNDGKMAKPKKYYINDDFSYDNIDIIDNHFVYKTKNYTYNMYFDFECIYYISEEENQFTTYYKDLDDGKDRELFAKLNIYYFDVNKNLNIFGYYNEKIIGYDENGNSIKFCDNLKLNELTNVYMCDVHIPYSIQDNDFVTYVTVKDVILYESASLLEYSDLKTNMKLTYDNPSLYWLTNKNMSIDIVDGTTLLSSDNNDLTENKDSRYINYLCRNLTGISGSYKILFIIHDGFENIVDVNEILDKFKLCLNVNGDEIDLEYKIIYDENNKLRIECDSIFTFMGKEESILLYFKISLNNNISNICIEPKLIEYDFQDVKIEFNEMTNQFELYNTFFKHSYSIFDCEFDSENNIIESSIIPIREIWENKINIEENNIYDAYLMHDENIWYFNFITKETCDKYNSYDINNIKKIIEFNFNNKRYKLKYSFSKKMFLINRMKINYVKDGKNHFNMNDIIVCTLYNNKMLPSNINLSTKWEIKPLSYKLDSSLNIHSNSNICILSCDKSNKYNPGYYNISISYSLDGNTLNNTILNKKILVQK